MRRYAVLFVIGLVGYGALAWDRLGRQSPDPHFVLQAAAWLDGQASIDPPYKGDDWAKVETVVLDDGSRVEGRRLVTRPTVFRSLDGDEIPLTRIRQSRGKTLYVSFPPFPSLVMLPSALIGGRDGNDMIPALVIAALALPLMLLVLRRLAEAGLSTRSPREDLWLTIALGFGTVFWFTAEQGRVWYAAHVIGVVLALVYAWASVEAKHPVIAGLALGAAALTRTSMAFMFPLFLFEAWRIAARQVSDQTPASPASASMNLRAGRAAMRKALIKPIALFAGPVVVFAIAGGLYNLARFGSFGEFGHRYLEVVQQSQIEQYGLMHLHYLGRNLAVAFTLIPELLPRAPWVQISGHGLAIWVTTPVVLLLLWPRIKNPLHRPLWITVAAVALPSLLYQNSGWFQFGYRFSLDYMVLLIMLLAIGGRPLGRVAKTLIVIGIVVNLFGAATFNRTGKYYRGSYGVVVPH
ncbi:MAG: hypothetical protein AB7P03_12330 [Kofleriaceae bacterium]